jgi:hypothetical protein
VSILGANLQPAVIKLEVELPVINPLRSQSRLEHGGTGPVMALEKPNFHIAAINWDNLPSSYTVQEP